MTQFWKDHGTKLLGLIVALIGALGDVQQLFIAYDSNPKHVALYSLIVALGTAIIRRGFTNSATPPPTPVVIACMLAPWLLPSLLVACASLSFQQQLAAAYGTYTTVERAADQAFVSGSLPRAQAEAAREMARQVRPFLDGAQAASTSGDQATASNDLELASQALGALQKYVDAQLSATRGK
jgi:hypothetical protein